MLLWACCTWTARERAAHRERGSLAAGPSPASLKASGRTPDAQIRQGPSAGSSHVPAHSWGPGGRAQYGCADPSPSSPALASRLATACQHTSVATSVLLVQTTIAPTNLLLANSRLGRRLVSLNARPAHLVRLMLGCRWGRCRTFLEYGPLAPIAAPWRLERVTGVEPPLSAWELLPPPSTTSSS